MKLNSKSIRTMELHKDFLISDYSNKKVIDVPTMRTVVLTDGILFKKSADIKEKISEYIIGKDRYSANYIKYNDVTFFNYNYIITCLIADEYFYSRTKCGSSEVLKNINVYYKDTKDKNTLKKVKRLLLLLKLYNISNYNSLQYYLFKKIEYKELDKTKTYNKYFI